MKTNNVLKPLDPLETLDPLEQIEPTEIMGVLGTNATLYLFIYLFVVNVAAFILYGVDKHRAKKGAWRIPEKVLLGIAVIGGSAGALAGMSYFHHKTRHRRFKYGLPIILLVHLLLAAYFGLLS